MVLNKDCSQFADDLPMLIESYFPEKALVELMVIDPPYGLNKARWDSAKEAEKWAQSVIPGIITSLQNVEADFLSPTFKIVIFHHIDSDYLWVCLFGVFFPDLGSKFRICSNNKRNIGFRKPSSGSRTRSSLPNPTL